MSPTKQWIVVNIGCLECGIGSDIVGVFDDKEVAESLAAKLNAKTGSDERTEVFDMPELNVINTEFGL